MLCKLSSEDEKTIVQEKEKNIKISKCRLKTGQAVLRCCCLQMRQKNVAPTGDLI